MEMEMKVEMEMEIEMEMKLISFPSTKISGKSWEYIFYGVKISF